MPTILQSAAYQNNGLAPHHLGRRRRLGDGPIGMIVLSPLAKGGGYHNALHYTHSSTLRTLQKIFGVTPFLGGAATALDLSDLFVPGAIPNGDPQVVIQEVTHTPSTATIRWTSQPGITYRCQWKNQLIGATWQSITPDFAGTGGLLSWTDNGTQTGGPAPQRFYRVVVP